MKYLIRKAYILGFVFVSLAALADNVDGLYAQTYGHPKNQAIVFLHGGPGYNSYSFEFSTAKALSDRGYFVLVFDQRGSGRSAKALRDQFTYANAVADVRKVIQNYALAKPIIIGHSWGGTLGALYAQAYPDDYKSLLMVDAPMDQPGTVKNILDRCANIYAGRNDTEALGYVKNLEQEILGKKTYVMNQNLGGYVFYHATMCGLYKPRDPTLQQQAIWQNLRGGSSASLLNYSAKEPFAGLIKNDHWLSGNLLPSLKSLAAKVYVIIGKDDGLFGAEQLDAIERAVPNGHFKLVENASHNLFIDQQETFLEFVDEVAKH